MRRRAFIQTAFATAGVASIPCRDAFAVLYRPVEQYQQLPDVDAVTGDGQHIRLTGVTLADLRARLRGRLLLAGNPGYDDARRIRNPAFDKRPALIVQPTGVADIRTAVDFARENRGLLLAVKCGGHSFSGLSTCDRGMQIDLSLFRDVRVDPAARRAWVTGGCLLGQVDHETTAFGLATPLGTVSDTGVGGLATGGGFGRLARRFGLSVDNVVAVDVVTADGQLRHASNAENPDLLWGVRGGGGNFGIVTNFEFQLHPMPQPIFTGNIVYPIELAREGLRIYGDYAHEAPDELNLSCALGQPAGGGRPRFIWFVNYSGPAERLESVLAPVRRLGTPIADRVQPMNYSAAQRGTDTTDPRVTVTYLKGGFVPSVPAGLVDAVADHFRGDPRRQGGIFFENAGGAIARVPAGATAFVHRDIHSNMFASVAWTYGEDGSEHIEWLKQYWAGIEPFTKGFYVNNMPSDATPSSILASYRSNEERLVAIKNMYDPKNLFRLNPNVRPTVTP